MNLPNNPQLESHFIGQSLLEKKVISQDVSTSDFYNLNYRGAWSAICELEENQQEIEPHAIIGITKQFTNTFGVADLMQTCHGLVNAFDMVPLVSQLKDLSLRRYLIRALSSKVDDLQGDKTVSGTVDELAIIVENAIDEMVEKESGFESLSRVIEAEVRPALADLVLGQTKKISTGFHVLDSAIGGGFTLSDVILVVSDTGSGKSAFVLQLADQIAKQGLGVAYVSGEMRNRENGLRLLTQNAGVTNLNSVVHISNTERDILDEWATAIKDRPIFFDHASGDLQTIKTNLRTLIKKQDIKVLILDYIQLYRLTPNDKFARVERLTEVSQEVKRIANEFGICIVEVAQFNREGMKKEKATMHDLEGSGQLEKDTSLIFIIDRKEGTDEIELRIVKGRNSGQSAIFGRFTGRTLVFEL